MEGGNLPIALSAAVPLWIMKFKEYSYNDLQTMLRILDESDFCVRMEYVLHKGPKEGDTARAFNDLAKCIAIMSFCPGGITIFGMHFEDKHPDFVASEKFLIYKDRVIKLSETGE